jgi:hydrogenase nickel incorporation protein HypA/HybF
VHLIVGQFTCVEPASLQFAFEVQTRHTFLVGAELVIRETPLIAFCHTCQQDYSPQMGIQYACPTCRSPMEDIRSGRELKIDRVEFASDVAFGEKTCCSPLN